MAATTILKEICVECGKPAIVTQEFSLKPTDDSHTRMVFILQCGHSIIKAIPKAAPFHTLTSNWWEPIFEDKPPCEHIWNGNQCVNCAEYKAFPFQVEGAQFLEKALAINKGGALFDEMGLGKTIQVLLYLKYHPEIFPVVFVVKSGIKYQWFKEILRWLGPKYLPQVITSSKDYILPQMKSYVISYDMLVFREKVLKKSGKTSKSGLDPAKFAHCKTIVLDECQQIKNPESARSKQIRRLAEDKQVIGLSGTPWKNRGSEFFMILNLINPMKFPSEQRFLNDWVDYYWDSGYQKQGGIKRVPAFKEYTKDMLIRREIADVAIQMPDVIRTLHFTELDKLSQLAYDDEVSEFVRWYNDAVIGGEEEELFGDINVLAKMARMRHITGLAKIPATLEFVEEFYNETDRKLTIFVHHKDVSSIIYDKLKETYPDIPVMHLTADLSGEERFAVQERFQESKRAFLVASTLASGEGINLQTCGDAIMHERQWNPQNEDQAAPGRFRRIGATHSRVNVTFVTAAGTIDEILAGIVERKRAYFHNAMNQGEMPTWNQGGLAKELAEGIVAAYNDRQREKGKLTRAASL